MFTRTPAHRPFAALVLAGLSSVAAAQVDADGEPQVVFERLDGQTATEPLAGFRLDDPSKLEAVFMRFTGLVPRQPIERPQEESARLGLASGDVLRGWIDGGNDETLEFLIARGVRLSLSIEELQELVFPLRFPSDGSVVPAAPPEGDRLFRRRGISVDRIDGLVQSFSMEGVSFESQLGARLYPWDEVAALFVEPLGDPVAEDAAPANAVIVDLRGASRVRGFLRSVDSERCVLTTASGLELALPLALIAEIALDNGSFGFLSDVPVQDAGPTSPFGDDLGMTWPHQIDRALDGGPLRAGGREWRRGIAVHAPSRLTWKLDGKWTSLRASIAIDDAMITRGEQRGSVRFRIHIDGELSYESPLVRGGDQPLAIPVQDLRGAREIVLEVDPHDQFVSDRANWLRPILVR